LLKARILLKADASEAGEGWSDSRIIAALDTSASMVYRVRKQLVEEGFEAVLSRKQCKTPPSRIFNANHTKADWHFTTKDARIKLKHLYPSI
jgi:transposase